jgi:hypothetical protein
MALRTRSRSCVIALKSLPSGADRREHRDSDAATARQPLTVAQYRSRTVQCNRHDRALREACDTERPKMK